MVIGEVVFDALEDLLYYIKIETQNSSRSERAVIELTSDGSLICNGTGSYRATRCASELRTNRRHATYHRRPNDGPGATWPSDCTNPTVILVWRIHWVTPRKILRLHTL